MYGWRQSVSLMSAGPPVGLAGVGEFTSGLLVAVGRGGPRWTPLSAFERGQRWDRGATEEEVFAPATTGNEWPSTSAARTDGFLTRTR